MTKTLLASRNAAALAALLLWPTALLAGEDPAKPAEQPAAEASKEPAAKPRPITILPQVRQQMPVLAASCGTIVLVKVVSAGKVEPDDNAPPQDQNKINAMARLGIWMGNATQNVQRARCEVLEVMRGDGGLKECTVLCRHFDVNSARQALWQEAVEAAKKKNARPNMNLSQEEWLKRAALVAGETYLLVLMPDETAKPAAGEKPPIFSTGFFPVQSPDRELCDEMRKLAKRIADYQNPPALTAEQLAAAKKHLADLGSADYKTRDGAAQALLDAGPAVLKLVKETAAATDDVEVRERCEQMLEDLKPIPGGSPEDWAGDAKISKDEEQPEGGKAAAPEAAPEVAPGQ